MTCVCKLGVFHLFLCLQAIYKLACYPNKETALGTDFETFLFSYVLTATYILASVLPWVLRPQAGWVVWGPGGGEQQFYSYFRPPQALDMCAMSIHTCNKTLIYITKNK